MDRRRILRFIRIAVYVLLLVSWIFLRLSSENNFGACYINENFGILCPSCGITRATKAILSLDFSFAIELHAYYVFVLLPVFLFLLIDDVICIILNRRSFVEIILRWVKEKVMGELIIRYFLYFYCFFVLFFDKS